MWWRARRWPESASPSPCSSPSWPSRTRPCGRRPRSASWWPRRWRQQSDGPCSACRARATRRAAGDRVHHLTPPADPRNDHHRGQPESPVTLVEFGDYSCPHTRAAEPALAELREECGRSPGRGLPPSADRGRPSRCPGGRRGRGGCGAQGRFWEMHDRLMADVDTLPVAELIAHAEALDLDVDRFSAELRLPRPRPAVSADLESARDSGAPGTPRSTSMASCWAPTTGAARTRDRIRRPRVSNEVLGESLQNAGFRHKRRPRTSVSRHPFRSPIRGSMFRRVFAVVVLLCLLCAGGAVGTLAWADKQSGTASRRASRSRAWTSAG